MEYAKEKILKLWGFNTNVKKISHEREKWTSRIFKILNEHKFISTVVGLFFLFLTINIILIYNFFKIL